MSEPLLAVDDLRVHLFTNRGVVRAVDGVGFALSAGKSLGIVGESGCGKTMTALSLMRLIPSPPARIVSGESCSTARMSWCWTNPGCARCAATRWR